MRTVSPAHCDYQQEAREMKYVMLILNTDAVNQLTEAEQQAWYSEIMSWYEKHGASGAIADMGHQLQGPETAKTARASGVTDGPFIESKEIVGGFAIVDVQDLAEAQEMAKAWPGGPVEVWPAVER
jgi:hypothetical protein